MAFLLETLKVIFSTKLLVNSPVHAPVQPTSAVFVTRELYKANMVVAWLAAGVLPYYSLRKESETPAWASKKKPAEEPIILSQKFISVANTVIGTRVMSVQYIVMETESLDWT